eukprot:Phypoly_transcript_05339.p1 GENE.Phypoly_transcript_05339~~Phypoly_transcript_05339.p1  ORF type:complete len:554 (+),score=88.69 Phypoly_transcript_05339:154-1815(+)
MKTLFTTLCALLFLVAVHGNKKLFPDTTLGFHWFLVFDTPILLSNESIDAEPYDLVWGASDRILPMYRATNPEIVTSLYIPWSRDNDPSHNLTYWNATHPDWVLYKCDRVTPAFQFTDPHMPLDISNPAVIDFQLQKYIDMVHQFNYDGIAADNFAIGNALNACGIWREGEWVQKYTGLWDDPVYNNDSLSWIHTFYARLRELAPDISFGINYSLNLMAPDDPRVLQVIDNLDYVMDEAGFTNWGYGLPDPIVWDQINTWIEEIQARGKHYFGINEFSVLTPQAKEWGMASYLMSKNDHSSMIATIIQGYGVETKMPEYDALEIGQALGPRNFSNGLYFRQYSNGLAVVNVYNDSVTFTLPDNGYKYKDVLGNTYGPDKPITIQGQSGIVMGATARPPTATLMTTITTTTSFNTGATTTTGHIGVSTSGGQSTTGNTGMSSTTQGSTQHSTSSSDDENPSSDGHSSSHSSSDATTDHDSSTTDHHDSSSDHHATTDHDSSTTDHTAPASSTGHVFIPSTTHNPSGSDDSTSGALPLSLPSLMALLFALALSLW